MKETVKLIMATADAGLLAYWHGAPGKLATVAVTDFEDLTSPAVLKFSQPVWVNFPNDYKHRLVATNSFHKDKEAIQALDDVCAGYCHAFSDANTLHQTSQVVGVGQVRIGKTLMQRLT